MEEKERNTTRSSTALACAVVPSRMERLYIFVFPAGTAAQAEAMLLRFGKLFFCIRITPEMV